MADPMTLAPDPTADEDLVTMCDVWMPGFLDPEALERVRRWKNRT